MYKQFFSSFEFVAIYSFFVLQFLQYFLFMQILVFIL